MTSIGIVIVVALICVALLFVVGMSSTSQASSSTPLSGIVAPSTPASVVTPTTTPTTTPITNPVVVNNQSLSNGDLVTISDGHQYLVPSNPSSSVHCDVICSQNPYSWRVITAGSNYIFADSAGKALLGAGVLPNPLGIQVWEGGSIPSPLTYGPKQTWTATNVGNNMYTLLNPYPGKYLGTSGTTPTWHDDAFPLVIVKVA